MIFIAYGANLPSLAGSPEKTYLALPALFAQEGVEVVTASLLYATKPVPASDQPDYMNAVLAVRTDLSAETLLLTLMRIENALGRVRSEKNAARGVDLDLIAYDDLVLDEADLIVPHPRMHERRFVIEPLAEIAPDWVHPVLGKSVLNMLKTLV
jgi:2-amino-4-hydroxy-6-hydroxymethyldihydropteridine diphosphokinase